MQSTSAVPYRRLTVTFLLAVLLVAYSLSHWAFRSEADARGIATALDGVLTLDPRSAADAVRSFELRGALGAVFTLALSFLLVAAPIASSFRLQRMMLNRYPDGAEGIEQEQVSEHAWRTDGLLKIEAKVFRAVGEPPPRELPIDLIVRAVSLLIPIWVALVLAALAATGSTSEPVVEWSLAVGTVLILLLVFDSLVLILRTARLRRDAYFSTEARPESRMLPRRVRLLALVLASLVLTAGVEGVIAPGPTPPTEDYAAVRQVTFQPNVRWRQYLGFQGLSTKGFPADSLLQRGVIIRLRLDLVASPGFRVKLRANVIESKTHRVLGGKNDFIVKPDDPPRRPARVGVNARELVLLHIGNVRRPVPRAKPKSRALSFWTRVEQPGAYYVQIRLEDNQGLLLEVVRTASFNIARA
jgi:hypothetical protein